MILSRKKIRVILSSVFIGSMLSLSLVPAVNAVGTEQQNAVCQGSELKLGNVSGGECAAVKQDASGKTTESRLNDLIAQIINIFSVIVGIVAVIMIIYGGFRYVTSGGEAGNLTTSKNIILYAIVGLIIVALAQFVVKFILSKVVS